MWNFMNIVKKVTNSLKQDGISGFITKVKKHFYNEEKSEYYKWIKQNTPSSQELKKQRNYKFNYAPKISIVVPLYNTPKKYLLELIKYVQKQTYSNWELCFADGSTEPLSFVETIANKDNRIKYKILKENKGISGNTDEALKMVT